MLAMIQQPQTRQQHYDDLLSCADGSASSIWLAQMVASWLVGDGVLPDRLGLNEKQFNHLFDQHFPGYDLRHLAPSGITPDFSRMLEKQDLEQLLRKYAAIQSHEIECLITIIVSACLGSDHLWQDLGLWSRSDLSALLEHYFPELVLRNSKDMKWKKFLYKQLCETEGLYLCRAPSCEVCKDYPVCFGPES